MSRIPEETLRRLWELGAKIHLDVVLDPGAFAAHATSVFPDDAPQEPNAAGLFLACACLRKDPQALQRLGALLDQVSVVLARVEPSPEEQADVRQTVLEQLVVGAKLRQYSGQGSLERWLKAVLVGVAIDRRRAAGSLLLRGQEEEDTALVERSVGDEAELSVMKARYRAPFKEALRAALAELSPRERNLLRLHYLSELSLEQVAQLHAVHRATCARWLSDARGRLLASTVRRFRAELRLSESESAELIPLLQSQLEASLRAMLRPEV